MTENEISKIILLNFYTKSLKDGIKRLIFSKNFELLCDIKKSYTTFHKVQHNVPQSENIRRVTLLASLTAVACLRAVRHAGKFVKLLKRIRI